MVETLVTVLGWQMVGQALRDKEQARAFTDANPSLVSDSCKALYDAWGKGNPRAYLASLPVDLRNCLICNLAGDLSADVLADYGLVGV